jgi:RimJ/RimL family protein N-acetyltransferase
VDVSNLVTERLRLRRITLGDLPALIEISTDPRTNAHRPGGAPTPAQSQELLREFVADWERHRIGYWVVEHRGEVIGIAGVKPVSVNGAHCWNLYYRFAPESWGQGFAAEAAATAVTVARQREPQRPVVARTRPSNHAAIRLAERIGMVRRPDLDWRGLIAFAAPEQVGAD